MLSGIDICLYWLIKAADLWLLPIYDEMKRLLKQETVLHADETTLQVLKESGKTAKSKSYMWLYRTSGCAERQIVLFEYQPDRKAVHPAEFLTGFSGYLHADGYSGYHNLPKSIKIVGCFAHLRRKFDEALTVLYCLTLKINTSFFLHYSFLTVFIVFFKKRL